MVDVDTHRIAWSSVQVVGTKKKMTSDGMKRGTIQTHLLSDVTMTRRTAGSMKGVPEQKGSEIYAMGIRTGPRRWTKCYAYSFE